MPVYRLFLGGRVPLVKQTTDKKVGLILTSLLEDLVGVDHLNNTGLIVSHRLT